MAGDSATQGPRDSRCRGGEDCTAGLYLEIAWLDGSSSMGHRQHIGGGRLVIGDGWAHSDPITCPHGGESTGIWLDEQHRAVTPDRLADSPPPGVPRLR